MDESESAPVELAREVGVGLRIVKDNFCAEDDMYGDEEPKKARCEKRRLVLELTSKSWCETKVPTLPLFGNLGLHNHISRHVSLASQVYRSRPSWSL